MMDTPANALIDQVALGMYRPPLVDRKFAHEESQTELGILLLFLEFDTEVQMSGILGFLENSTGQYLNETIAAFQRIGAESTAAILTNVQAILSKNGVTTDRLCKDLVERSEFDITSFREVHGASLDSTIAAIQTEVDLLYVYGDSREDPYELLVHYVDANFNTMSAQLSKAVSQ